jgi:hypothetical protein
MRRSSSLTEKKIPGYDNRTRVGRSGEGPRDPGECLRLVQHKGTSCHAEGWLWFCPVVRSDRTSLRAPVFPALSRPDAWWHAVSGSLFRWYLQMFRDILYQL